ncbi:MULTISPECIES: glycosyltransferase family 2 protein [Lachnospiraceae]|jgi:GT2 family glycosyltransferase|uniref:glycosyltransferase family 2 protein n=1 Tax=Lachnospiraceae TaxID=186803 RepID=UPI000E47B553|nr:MULTISPECIES: glycosyltransferase family 2 protein [Lachnospiraceae]MCB5527867.1 glycosyltransferase family 2 protein [Fusicatenibacter saccharivorans]MCB5673630.1 glycosyltransferase family 2 protein [Fusicatenibacter saccharivorans]MCB5692857.1 glycosyltransferase family 2 protein [Fusicatenibacter saccharivorans]MCB5696413.1 glycosyltransferase family 2 protein [Fusicatenibacter saccharivorans]MCC2732016.1 glycosyltransferase family 2 protein [Fusicatenibacter saccharivorans]
MAGKSVYVILVNYNGLNDTEECIRSLKQNSYDNYKIIVVDNCSPDDNIYDLKDKWNDLIIVSSLANEGFAKANNHGIDIALQNGADYVLLLNNDTIVEKDFLENMVVTAQKLAADVLTCKIMYNYDRTKLWYGGGKIDWKKGYGIHYVSNELKDITEIEFVTGCCMLLKKNVVETLKLPEDYFMYFEDVDYCVKLREHGFSIFYSPYIKLYHKVSASAGIESPFFVYYWNRNRLIFMKKYRYRVGTLSYYMRVSFFLLTRLFKTIGYILHGDFEKNQKMFEGVKAGISYKIKTNY